ncbi:MAG: hypothetical protein CMF31_11015 [Kordiimonas sp.]|nr:hypothetical protein [Kordiimonas sp.]|tara:strand:+ start:292 stop:525 length:234 start_codon:yes stop_codon:yes gene_type:complete
MGTTRPHALINANWQDDPFNTTHLVEAGPGISIKHWFNERKHEAYRSSAELIVQYRVKVTGDSAAGSGWTATLLVSF